MRTPQSSPYERQQRLTEALLLLLVFLILCIGMFLAGLAKGHKTALPSDKSAVNINIASAGELTGTLAIPATLGKRLLEERAKRGGFGDVDALGRIPVVPEPRAAAAKMVSAGIASPRTATRQNVQKLLGLDTASTDRLFALRAAYPKSGWAPLLRSPLISSARLNDAKPRLIARPWSVAVGNGFGCGMALLGFFTVAHLALRRFRPNADPFLLPITALLSTLSLLLLWSLKDPLRDMPSYLAQTQGIVGGGAVALLAALSPWLKRAPLHRYSYVYALLALGGTLLLGVLGSGPGGVKLSVAGTQPVEAIKILLIFFLAAYLAERGPLLNDPLRKLGPFPVPHRRDALPLLVLYALPLGLFAIVRDLGPVLLLFGTFLMLLYLATGRAVYVILGLAALGLGGFIGYTLHFGVFETRVDMWRSPWNNLHKSGDHLALGWWGLASGGTWGSGLGLGGTRFIPRGGSDLAYASLGEEMGFWGTAAVTLCFLVAVARGFRIAGRAATEFDRYLAAGLSCLLGLQALIIAAGTLGLLPLSGITLPFVSYGKSSLIASFFLIGMLLALSERSPAAPVAPAQEYRTAAKRLLLFFALTLGAGCLTRLLYLQEIASDKVAGNKIIVPDADGVKRPHINPRLLSLAESIPRGRLLDRNGIVLAETKNRRRVYPLGEATAHLVGYADPTVGGPTGFERDFATNLRGFENWAGLVSLWRRKDFPGFRLPEGEDVTLTLDSRLQQEALGALQRGAARIRDRRTGRPKNRGSLVILDVETGAVLAAVTSPTFDPNKLTPATLRALQANLGDDYPLINRAVSGYYPPGSTFKVVTAASQFVENKTMFTVQCNHTVANLIWKENGETYARRRIVDDESDRPHGQVDISEAIEESCNVYFSQAAIALGAESFHKTASDFGFAKLPSVASMGKALPEISFGQGPMLATPLEMANVAQTIAGAGKRLTPQFLESASPKVAAQILSPDTAAQLSEMMWRVTRSGTAAGRFNRIGVSVAGKTGTAQNNEGDKMSHSWFIGFAPADRPRIAFAVVVENGGYGATAAVPIAREIVPPALSSLAKR